VTPFGAGCPAGLQAIVSKLLAGSLADRYGDAAAIRQDLESLAAGRQTEAERQGWPKAEDEPPTRRTRPDAVVDAEATRRTVQPAAPSQPSLIATAAPVDPPAAPARTGKWRDRLRSVRAALLLLLVLFAVNEYRVSALAGRLAANVPTRELEGLAEAWDQYDGLSGHSSNIGVVRLRRALVRQSETLADRVIGNYRSPVPTVREPQWKMAREALAHAVTAAPDNASARASLRYCEGHLHRINGEARKARRQIAEAQHEFTDAVTAFREAAELRSNWPDPFLGLMRTFIYGLEDVDRGADALQQAQRLGYTPGDRETVQLADGYRSRGDTFARTARTLNGMAQEQQYLTRAAEAYRLAVDRYMTVLSFGDAARSLRLAQRSLEQVEERLAELAGRKEQPTPKVIESLLEALGWP
jgi:hypothetical protein